METLFELVPPENFQKEWNSCFPVSVEKVFLRLHGNFYSGKARSIGS